MQLISPSWHCGRNTRRGPSHRLKTNLLCLAALFLFALMPSVGWAQQQSVPVTNAQELRAALETNGDVIIDIDVDTIILFNGHTATNSSGSKEYNSLYLVAEGKKTINGKNHTIRRGTEAEEMYYANSSIVLESGAHLVINNLTLHGKDAPNYASMVVVPPKIKKTTNNGNTTSEYAVNAKLEMTNCTIQNCLQRIVTETELTAFHNTQVSSLNAYNYEAFASTSNNGGAGVHFAPGKAMSGNIDNTISLNGCIFKANKIQERTEVEGDTLKKYENGGALALAGEFARGGTIEGCKFQQNYARNYGGAIWFEKKLKPSNGSFQFLGTTLVGGSVAMKNWSKVCGGGIAVEGGRVIFNEEVDIQYNTTEGDGGGIFISGGEVTFTKKVTISNNTALRGGGICQNGGTLEITSNNTPSQTIKIENNTATVTPQNTQYNTYEGGGGVLVMGGTTTNTTPITTFTGTESNPIQIINNKATNAYGGGILVHRAAPTFTFCNIGSSGNGNSAARRGGGIYLASTESPYVASFTNCNIDYNYTTNADSEGGGVYNYGEMAVYANTFTNCYIRYNGENGSYKTKNGGGVYLYGSTRLNNCTISNNKATGDGGGLYMYSGYATLSNGCHVNDNTANQGGGIYYKNGSFENTNYVYNNTATTNGGGVFVEVTADRTLSGLVIGSNVPAANADKGNKAQQGGGVYTYSTSDGNKLLTINNCKIVYNQNQSDGVSRITSGGGLCMANENSSIFSFSHTVELTGGTLIDNNKAVNGGGVYLTNIGALTLKLTNTTLSDNEATTGHGGGIYNNQTVTSEGASYVSINSNKALNGNGGGIYNNGTCSLKNCQIGQSGKGNEAATAGGGIFVESGATTTLLPGNITFEDNRASGTDTGNGNGNQGGSGGGIYNLGTVTQRNTCKLVFDHNIANQDGGGIYHEGDPLTLTNAIFKNNTATENGGGIYTAKTCILNNCTMGKDSEPNHAKNGGGIYKKKDELTIQGGSVSHNTASINGGGIYLEHENTLVYDSCLIQNNKATYNGGGIYVQGANEAAGLAGTRYSISAITVLDLTTNETVGLIKRLANNVWLNTLCGPGSLVSHVEIRANGSTFYDGTPYFEYPHYNNYGQPPYTAPIEVDQNTTEIRNYLISLKLDGNEENPIWDDGNHKVIARFEYPNDDYFEVEGIVSYDYYYSDDPELSYLNVNEYYYEVTSVPIAGMVRTATLTLNGSTVGGAGKGNEASKGNEAGTGDGGGIYIEKYAKVIMTSDGSSTAYSNGIRNDVTHNKAKQKAGGVYKDGTLQVEGHVIITENEAEHSTGGGSKAGEVPENVYIPTESDDDQTILIIGELACGSSIGVTKTKKWMEEGEDDENATTTPATAQYGTQGEHIYDRDDHLKQVRTAIAKVVDSWEDDDDDPSTPNVLVEKPWAENAFHKRIFFDDKGYYRVWSFNYSNSTNTDNAYSDQNDYFIETWRSFANATGFSNNTVSTNAGFAYFAKQVNDGETVSAASQNATIDLAGHYWEPIGYTFCGECGQLPHRPFAGTYNGNGHFILNAISILPEKEMGLFGNVTGTVKHTFAVGNLFANTHDHTRIVEDESQQCGGHLGAIVGNTTGTIDGCEAAGFTLKGYATATDATVAAGGIAGNVGASGEVRNSFTSGITFTGTITNAGGLVGNIASGGAVKNCYSKAAIPASGTTKGALVGKNAGLLSNAYTSATTGAIVGNGTQGTNVYVYSAGATGATATYTAPIGADHLGYMCIDNGVAITNTNGLTEGKDYFKFKNASGSEVNLIPLFRLLNLNAKALNNNSDNYTTYAEWARPALAFYEGLGESASTTGSINSPINGDLPLLMLNNYDGSTHIGQGGFRSVGTYGGGGDVLQYGGPDRDGNELDAALTRPKVTGFTGNDYLFVYGDVNVAPAAELNAFTQAKVSIYEHAAISRAGTLAGFTQTYVGVTFDNSGKVSGSATNGINYIDNGPSLPRNWHMLSTPLTNAPLGFRYGGDADPHNKPIDKHTTYTNNHDAAGFFNNPWGNAEGSSDPNSPSNTEFSWLGNSDYATGHTRYWMHGWNNSRDAGAAGTDAEYSDAEDALTYPASTWKDGYFPSKVNTSAIQFGAQLFIPFHNNSGSNEYVNGNHRYPYGMDFYSWYEPKYHYINFKRNGPNHWHSNAPHVHLDYTPEEASNNSGATAFGQNVNETTLLDGKGYMASIHIPTFLQTSGSLGGSTKTIKVTYNENDLDLCEGWNLVGNPFHAYLDFNAFSSANSAVGNQYVVYNADGFGRPGNGNYGDGFSYYVAGSSQHGAYASQYLHPHQGFFVKVGSSTTLNFAESQTVLRSQIGTSGSYRDDSRPAYPLVNLFLTSDKGCSDVCVVEFNRPEWGGATKLRDMYSGNGLFYAAHDDGSYAALFATPEAERIPLKFEAKDEAGDTYTIHWNTQNGDFHKLYLVDNITGVQYDMLRNSSYSFSGKKDDYWTRFYITFEVTGLDEEQDDEDDDASTGSASTTFAFFDGSQWVVTNDGHGTATLDLIDLQGRVLHSTTLAEGQARIGLPDVAKGMYLMRMTNQNGMFVQKIVVR